MIRPGVSGGSPDTPGRINITSMGGKLYTPLGGWCHGSKFDSEALSDCLRLEVKPFGIEVVVIEPGGIETEWGGIAADKVEMISGGEPSRRRPPLWRPHCARKLTPNAVRPHR